MFVLALGVASFAVAGEWINIQDARKLRRLQVVDELIAERNAARLEQLRTSQQQRATAVSTLQTRVNTAEREISEKQDSDRTIVVSTAENKVYLKQGGQTLFAAICSTGKGTTLIDGDRTMVFNTPIGKFRVLSKEENPVWVPPDWHYLEEARKQGKRVVKLGHGDSIDANTGYPVSSRGGGVWSWFESGSNRVIKVRQNRVVIVENGAERELPPGEMITAGDAVVIPPVGTPQRKFDKVLGSHRLNLGDGYALHGTQQVAQLGRSVSHGCVRLKNEDIAQLYQLTQVGDEVIIY
jgi:lipoprotein-anchoring transpeptidase ErfK/SrfK